LFHKPTFRDLFFWLLKVLAKVLRVVLECSRRFLVLQAVDVMAWKRSSVRSRSGPPINPTKMTLPDPDLFFLEG
jgi:hypothetical protein